MYTSLSNTKLIETYENALKLRLDEDFIRLLEEEINRRGIELEKVGGRE